ncbi:MAG: hypothetical protein KGY67_00660 [Candidatus Thermoplasmatota archaeon]|nr:hypothetical protein [Candidatus Thermoplasmatota archaeon]
MIKISLKSGTYTFGSLDKNLSTFFDDKIDRDLFIKALMNTGQIEKQGNIFILPETHKYEYTRPKYVDLETYRYAGGGRVGVRVGNEWVDKFGFPSEFYISKIEVDGEMINVKEKPQLSVVKGRYPETIEAWRAEIPSEIRKKYNITPKTKIHMAVKSTTYELFTNLQLWGYRYRVMLMYGETSNGVNPRNLELDGSGFVSETKRDISSDLKRDQRKIKKTIEKLLFNADAEYFSLYEQSKQDGYISDNLEAIPLKEKTSIPPIVQFRDLANKRIIANWESSEKQKIPDYDEFRVNLNLDFGLQRIRGKTKLEKKWGNKSF